MQCNCNCIHTTTSTTPDLESDFPESHPWGAQVAAHHLQVITHYPNHQPQSSVQHGESQPYIYTYKLSHIIQPITTNPSNPSADPIISGESQPRLPLTTISSDHLEATPHYHPTLSSAEKLDSTYQISHTQAEKLISTKS